MMASRSRRSAETFCQIQSPSPRQAASRSRNRERIDLPVLHRFRVEPRQLLLQQPVAAHEDGGAVRGLQRQELAAILDPARVRRLAATDRRERVALLDHDVGEKGIRPTPGAAAGGMQHRRQRSLASGQVPGIRTDQDQQDGFFRVLSGMGGSGVDRGD